MADPVWSQRDQGGPGAGIATQRRDLATADLSNVLLKLAPAEPNRSVTIL